MKRLLVPLLAAPALSMVPGGEESAARGSVDFERDVRPILERRCVECHSSDQAQGGLRLDLGAAALAGSKDGQQPVILPGNPAESILIERLVASSERERMPAKGEALPAAEIETLRNWIAAGAPWPVRPGDPEFKVKKHWAYAAPVTPKVPEVHNAAWVRSSLDAFVAWRLEREKLEPSAEADRATWLRRVSLDLTGIPPSLEETRGFVADSAPGAHERAVDRLLASTRYGERMASLWLDLARYADTNGYEKDDRRSMWPYRDWVIDAFNADMPFDRFTVEQLAGDLLPNATEAQRIATGFHRNTMVNAEGGVDPEEFRVAAVVDRVNTTASVWLGSTLACAQCHNHKYDPFTQREYYGLFAFLNNTTDVGPTVDPMMPVRTEAHRAHVEELRREEAAALAMRDAPDPELDAELPAFEAAVHEAWGRSVPWIAPRPDAMRAASGSAMALRADGAFVVSGTNPAKDVLELELPAPALRATALRLEALPDPSLPRGGSSRAEHGNFVLSGIEAFVTRAGGGAAEPLPFASAGADYEQSNIDHSAATAIDKKARTGWAIGLGGDANDVAPHEAVFAFSQPVEFAAGDRLLVKLRFESRFAQHNLGCGRVSLTDSADAAASVAPFALSAWLHAGPFPAESYGAAFSSSQPPEAELLQAKPFSELYEGGKVTWRPHPEWKDAAVHALSGDLSAHFLRRTVRSDRPRAAVIRLGSDDGVKLWVDGKLVHSNESSRAAAVRQDSVNVHLPAGECTILMKVVNGTGPSGFAFELSGRGLGMPPKVLEALRAGSEGGSSELRRYYRECVSSQGRERVLAAEKATAERAALEASAPTTLVLVERETPRETKLLIRGSFLNPGDPVAPRVPSALGLALPTERRDRLALAQWLVNPKNPLTARVLANRLWALLFGSGIVVTQEDFGTRGDAPSHPELLDWLACRLVEGGWSIKKLLREVVLSATYRQSSAASPEKLERDPNNRLLSRGPRGRMEAEMLRDAALCFGGILYEHVGGPSVFPVQPDGVWNVVYNGDRWETSPAPERWRRGVYTFLRRTSPYPTFLLFDAPSRELACLRRPASNTPLQALATLNDPAFLDAAAGLARRMLTEGGAADEARLAFGFELCTSRKPRAAEVAVLARLLASRRSRLAADGALVPASPPEIPMPAGVSRAEIAAWTAVANSILNLDEVLTKG